MGEDFERPRFVSFGGRRGGNEIAALQARLGDARIGEGDLPDSALFRLLGACARRDRRVALDLAVGRFGELLDLRRADVAGDHDDGVVGRIEAPVERERIFACELLDLMPPADDRLAIGMVEVERRHHVFPEARGGTIGDALILLLQHHIELRLDDRVR